MDMPEKQFLKIGEIFLRFVGNWPYQNIWISTVARFFISLFLWIAFIFEMKQMFLHHNDLNDILDVLPEGGTILGVWVVYMVNTLKTKEFRKIIEDYCSDWKSDMIDEEWKIKKDFARQGKLLTDIGILYVIIILLPTMAIAKYVEIIILNKKDLENGSYIETTRGRRVNTTLCFTYITLFLITIIIVGFTYLVIILIYQACGMFSATRYRLQKALESDENEILVYREITVCIKKHQNVITFTNRIETFYLPCLPIVLLFFIVVATTTMVQISHFERIHVKSFVFCAGQFFLIALLNLTGQKVIDTSQFIGLEVYRGKWYTYPLSIQKLALCLIQMGNKQCAFNSSKVLSLSVQSFGVVIRTAVSYCMVIRSLQ